MSKLIWLPLEKLDQRYTVLWSLQYPSEFERLGIDYMTIEGEQLTNKIELGQVLDAYGTNYFKFGQLSNLIKAMHSRQVTSDDVLLFADIWLPGLEALEYIACLGGVRPKITGILHAGTYDSSDFTYLHGMRPWGRPLEECWFSFVDLMFVGSEYHKKMVLSNFNIPSEKIAVTGLPFYPPSVSPQPRSDSTIVFPHRLDPEKRPHEFDALKEFFPEATFIRTKDHSYTKEQYFQLLASSTVAVSFAQHENFGYGMLEATALGCIPLMPNGLSYAEYYPRELLYDTVHELRYKLEMILYDSEYREKMREITNKVSQNHQETFKNSIRRMLDASKFA